MIKEKGFLRLLIFSVSFIFASDKSDKEPDTLRNTSTEIDSTSVSAAVVDSGKTDSTVADSILAVILAKKSDEKPKELPLPELEIVSFQFVDFFDKELVIRGVELVCNARYYYADASMFEPERSVDDAEGTRRVSTANQQPGAGPRGSAEGTTQ